MPLVGYTWWPMFDLVAWAFRQGRGPLGRYIVSMGLWELDPLSLERLHTPLVDAFGELASRGAEPVGLLAPTVAGTSA